MQLLSRDRLTYSLTLTFSCECKNLEIKEKQKYTDALGKLQEPQSA